jgi:hypothetical protein
MAAAERELEHPFAPRGVAMSSRWVRVRCTHCPAKWPIAVTPPQPTVEAFFVACGDSGQAAVHWPPDREDAELIWSQESKVVPA